MLRRLVSTPLVSIFALSIVACSGGSDATPTANDGSIVSDATAGDTSLPDAAIDDGANGDDSDAPLLTPPSITRTENEGQLLPQRQSCAFKAGDWPASTIGTDYPIGDDIPIKHVIWIMQENRSFDQYFGRLVAGGYYKAGDFTSGGDAGVPGEGFSHSDEVDDPPATWALPDTDGGLVAPHPDAVHCFTGNHDWTDMHEDWDNGLNDMFVIDNDPGGAKSIAYEDDTVIPFYYALASTFSMGDRYFASVMSSTWPNRFFAMAATSFGIGDNSYCTIDTSTHPVNQLFANLEAGGHTWKDYTDGPHQLAFFSYFGWDNDTTENHLFDASCDLLNDMQNDTLPDVSYVMGDEVFHDSDEGPSDLAEIGGQWVEGLVRALMASPSWKDTVLFISYDENGGTADHVPPENACPPDGYAPHNGDGTSLPGAFDHTGFRVPFTVVSPYAKAHFVSHAVYDHTSIVRFIEAKFGLPALTGRDANATPPMEMFDWQNPPFMTPPTITAHTVVDPAFLASCKESAATVGCGTTGGS